MKNNKNTLMQNSKKASHPRKVKMFSQNSTLAASKENYKKLNVTLRQNNKDLAEQLNVLQSKLSASEQKIARFSRSMKLQTSEAIMGNLSKMSGHLKSFMDILKNTTILCENTSMDTEQDQDSDVSFDPDDELSDEGPSNDRDTSPPVTKSGKRKDRRSGSSASRSVSHGTQTAKPIPDCSVELEKLPSELTRPDSDNDSNYSDADNSNNGSSSESDEDLKPVKKFKRRQSPGRTPRKRALRRSARGQNGDPQKTDGINYNDDDDKSHTDSSSESDEDQEAVTKSRRRQSAGRTPRKRTLTRSAQGANGDVYDGIKNGTNKDDDDDKSHIGSSSESDGDQETVRKLRTRQSPELSPRKRTLRQNEDPQKTVSDENGSNHSDSDKSYTSNEADEDQKAVRKSPRKTTSRQNGHGDTQDGDSDEVDEPAPSSSSRSTRNNAESERRRRSKVAEPASRKGGTPRDRSVRKLDFSSDSDEHVSSDDETAKSKSTKRSSDNANQKQSRVGKPSPRRKEDDTKLSEPEKSSTSRSSRNNVESERRSQSKGAEPQSPRKRVVFSRDTVDTSATKKAGSKRSCTQNLKNYTEDTLSDESEASEDDYFYSMRYHSESDSSTESLSQHQENKSSPSKKSTRTK